MKRNGLRDASIGIDIGGTKSLYALVDSKFEVLAVEKLLTHPEKGGVKAFAREMGAAIGRLMREAGRRHMRVRYVGVGCAGDIDLKHGIVRGSPNIAFLENYPMHERLARLTQAEVFVGHDVQAALYGELKRGVARKARDVLGVWLGTGVGGALILDRRLHIGVSGHAGNLGNYLLHSMDVSQELPRKEILDTVASRTAIAGDAAALAASHRAPQLQKSAGADVYDIKAAVLAEAIRKGDKAVEKLVRSRAGVVGTALSNLVDFINPDMIVLGGGLVEAMPSLMRRRIKEAIDAHSSRSASKAVAVRVAKLGDHAGTIGAACLAADMSSDDPPIDFSRARLPR